MKDRDAKLRLVRLQSLGIGSDLTVFGWPQGSNVLTMQFKAGQIGVEPESVEGGSDDTDLRLQYVSWDGLRRRDVTDMTDGEFVAYMRNEPEGMTELKR